MCDKVSSEMQVLHWASLRSASGGILILKTKIRSWFEKCLEAYQTKDVTPYMHALYCHVPQFLSLYQDIACCTQQGMEKYNDQASKDYIRSTNHRGTAALEQLF